MLTNSLRQLSKGEAISLLWKMYYFPDPEAAMNEKEATAQIACAELNKARSMGISTARGS